MNAKWPPELGQSAGFLKNSFRGKVKGLGGRRTSCRTCVCVCVCVRLQWSFINLELCCSLLKENSLNLEESNFPSPSWPIESGSSATHSTDKTRLISCQSRSPSRPRSADAYLDCSLGQNQPGLPHHGHTEHRASK